MRATSARGFAAAFNRARHSSIQCAYAIEMPGGSRHAAFHYGGIITALSYGLGAWPLSIWYHRKWSTALKGLIDAALYGVATGLVFMWLWPKG